MAAPSAAVRGVHRRRRHHGCEPYFRGSQPLLHWLGQSRSAPTRERLCAHTQFHAELPGGPALRRQQPRHRALLERLAVSRHLITSLSPWSTSSRGDNYSDAEGLRFISNDAPPHSQTRAGRARCTAPDTSPRTVLGTSTMGLSASRTPLYPKGDTVTNSARLPEYRDYGALTVNE
jgi:hypothetical protein